MRAHTFPWRWSPRPLAWRLAESHRIALFFDRLDRLQHEFKPLHFPLDGAPQTPAMAHVIVAK